MKRKFVVVMISLILVALIWFGESRKFYCLDDQRCVTVWKTFNNTCYIIPGKYYGLIKPSSNYIQTTNTQYLTIYYSDREPKTVVVRDQGTSDGLQGNIVIENQRPTDLGIVRYSERFQNMLYKPNPQAINDVLSDVYIVDIDIKENYATDRDGTRL